MDTGLGTLGSWMRDAVLAGALMPGSVMVAIFLVFQVLDGGMGSEIGEFAALIGTSGLIGAILAAATAPAAWWLACRAWKVPLVSFALGPAVGAGCAWVVVEATSLLLDGSRATYGPGGVLLLLAFGAFVLGPPWVGYVAVRSRGRSGLPAVLGSLLWAAGAGVMLILLDWLMRGSNGW